MAGEAHNIGCKIKTATRQLLLHAPPSVKRHYQSCSQDNIALQPHFTHTPISTLFLASTASTPIDNTLFFKKIKCGSSPFPRFHLLPLLPVL